MRYISLRALLNKLLWDNRFNIGDYSLTFIHRGAKEDKKVIPCRLITKVEKLGFTFESSPENKEMETFIPYHRILEIKNVRTGEILWQK